MSDVIKSLTAESLRDLLQRFGYRAEIVTDNVEKVTLLRSATSGMNFDIRFGNRLIDHPAQFVDFSFLGLFKVEGDLPLAPLNDWNNVRRFGRLHFNQGFLLLDMDVTVAGGATADQLRAHLEIWDQLLQALVGYLRTELPRIANGGAQPPSVSPSQQTAPALPS